MVIGCTEDVDLYQEGEPTPVVYCLLDPVNSIQYLRLGRTFRAGEYDPAQIQVPDSTVWNLPHEVYVEEYQSGAKLNRYPFEPFPDGRKDTGYFPDTNLRLYSAAFRPVPGNDYRLYVHFPDLLKMVSARITVHDLPKILDPVPIATRKINFEPGQPFTIRWLPGQHTGVYQMVFRIHYRDSIAGGIEFHQADYLTGGLFNQQANLMQESQMGGPSFFSAMASQIPEVPGIVREVASVEFILLSGGIDLGFLFRSDVERGTLFTNLGNYTNLVNGIGVFSSRTVQHIPNLTLSEVTLDLLARGETTKNLGFRDSKGK
ncbi:MAG: DUF4249 family protein [Bacteroidales bacterium]